MTRLALCVSTTQPPLLERCLSTADEHAAGDVNYLAFGNGCDVGATTSRFKRAVTAAVSENVGVPVALDRLYRMAIGDSAQDAAAAAPSEVLAFIHDDLFILEDGWDERVLRAFDDPAVGLVGFGGGTGLAAPNLYAMPYAPNHLYRCDFYSNMLKAETFGHRTTAERPIVFVDGYAIVLRKTFLDAIGGWSWFPRHIVHHGYDMAISCMARRHGQKAVLVPLSIEHGTDGWGAWTRSTPTHQALVGPLGGDDVVNAQAHEYVYNEFRDVLPLRLS